jgi:predicted GNAT family acetyltransferase
MEDQRRIELRDNRTKSRYEIRVDGELAGFVKYRDEGDRQVFLETQVDPLHRGEGLGQQLAEASLRGARAQGRKVEPRCEFIADYIGRHPQHRDLLAGSSDKDPLPTA